MTSLTTANAWLILIIAGLFEIGWPVGYQLSAIPKYRVVGWVMVVSCVLISGVLLWLAQKSIPIGTAYAVWTGIGAAGTFLVGVYFFNDTMSVMRFFGVAFIILGVITLKLAENGA
ncbi:DMT family transporter [Psychrobacter aestuarii]|uniref:Guanidinium exporter n=1 Tax=Psychrobacter aestuarii TaxID=556327 RepID=A0ABN0VZI6_9GAMM|nr:multidrug efflux SMR transporter [Psychrobacter aestuarii]